jgi:hypothetical protein
MRSAPCLDSTISFLHDNKKLRPAGGWTLFVSLSNCGCSSVVERLVANEKVASSTLVTRSTMFPYLRLHYEKK